MNLLQCHEQWPELGQIRSGEERSSLPNLAIVKLTPNVYQESYCSHPVGIGNHGNNHKNKGTAAANVLYRQTTALQP